MSNDSQQPISSDEHDQSNINPLQTFIHMMSESTKDAFMSIDQEKQLNNVGIFVDYDNVYWTLNKYYNHNPNHSDPSKNLFKQLWNKYGQDHVRTFRVYADFQKIREDLTQLQRNRIQIRNVYSNGKDGENRKNSSDIELCIDAIENTYKDPSISCYVFVTADSDMIPIMSRLMYKGKRVELYYLKDAAPKYVEMANYVHYCEDLTELLSIEEITFNLDDYILPALKLIKGWEDEYESTDYYLGMQYLKETLLSKNLVIPEIHVSDIIEKLQVDELIQDKIKKLTNGNQKKSISLTQKAYNLIEQLEGVEKIAAAEEKSKM